MKRYKSELDAPEKEATTGDTVMNWLTGAGQGAAVLNKLKGVKTPDVKYWGDTQKKAKEAASKTKLGKMDKLASLLKGYKTKKDDSKEGKIFQTRSGLVQMKEGVPTPIYEDPYMKLTGEVKEQSLGLRQEKFGERKIQKHQDDAAKAVDSLRKTDTWKSAEKTVSNIPEIEVLLDDAYNKGGQSLAMLGPRVAKGIAGEVGVLTEQDVTRYVKNPSLVGGMIDTLTKLKEGKITETSYENLKRLLQISKQTATDKINTAIDREAILLSRREQMPFEDAKYLLDTAYKISPEEIKVMEEAKTESKKSGKVAVELPNGKKGTINRNKLEAFKKKYPKAKILE